MLSDAACRGAKAGERPYKLSDGNQLYLYVTTAGARSWRMNYQFGRNAQGRPIQKTLTIGPYPAIGLKDARAARDQAKSMLARGIEPKPDDLFERRRAEEAPAMTFEQLARIWHELQAKRWSVVHAKDVMDNMELDVFPGIGSLAVEQVKPKDVMKMLQAIVDRGAVETAHRTRQRVSSVFAYGIALEHASADPAGSLKVALPRKPRSRPQPALTTIDGVQQLLIDCEAERCRAPTKLALRLLALTAVRSNELRGARWEEFEGLDGKAPLWRIPAARMKGELDRKADDTDDHLVPLAPAAVAVLRAVHRINGEFDLVFPGDRHFHTRMSENTLRALMIRAGYYQRHVPHGFRTSFSTIMNERVERQWREAGHKGMSPDRAIIDLMLAHVPPNPVEGVYNRAAYMERRRELACEWAELLVGDMWPPDVHILQPIRWAATGPGRPGSN